MSLIDWQKLIQPSASEISLISSNGVIDLSSLCGHFFFLDEEEALLGECSVRQLDDVTKTISYSPHPTHTFTVEEAIRDEDLLLGAGVWLSAVAFAFLSRRLSFESQRVLELGAGVGLASCLLLHHPEPPAYLLATDLLPRLVALSAENMRRNRSNQRTTFASAICEWSTDSIAACLDQNWDSVVACDCVYRTTREPLCQALDRLLFAGLKRIIVVSPQRRDGIDEMRYYLESKEEGCVAATKLYVCKQLDGVYYRNPLRVLIWERSS